MVRNIAIQVVIFVIIFNVFSWFQTRSMLTVDTQLQDETIILKTIMNDEIQLLSNDKNTVIYFFAPWCQICHLSIENLEEFYLENEDVNVIAVALDYMDVEQVRAFTEQHSLTFPVALGNENIKHKFSISAYPSYYAFNQNNKVVAKSVGYSSEIGMKLRALLHF